MSSPLTSFLFPSNVTCLHHFLKVWDKLKETSGKHPLFHSFQPGFQEGENPDALGRIEKQFTSKIFCPSLRAFTYLYPQTISTLFTRNPDFAIGCPPGKMLKSERSIWNLPSPLSLGSSQAFLYLLNPKGTSYRPRLWVSDRLGQQAQPALQPSVHLAGHGTLKLGKRNFGKCTSMLGAQHLGGADPA